MVGWSVLLTRLAVWLVGLAAWFNWLGSFNCLACLIALGWLVGFVGGVGWLSGWLGWSNGWMVGMTWLRSFLARSRSIYLHFT